MKYPSLQEIIFDLQKNKKGSLLSLETVTPVIYVKYITIVLMCFIGIGKNRLP